MLHIEQIKNLSKYDVTHVTEESLAYFIDLTRRIIKLQCNQSATVSERKTKPNFFEKSPKMGGFPER